ncbi:MAG: hypothetical protein LBP89_10305 [Helicobacteraceae bacterium]|jgi:hypothetical protein|nr:hypothetical protein [Helicobacteraceae bacterium]
MQIEIKAKVIDPNEAIYPQLKLQGADYKLSEGAGELIAEYNGKRIGISYHDLLNAAVAAIGKGDQNGGWQIDSTPCDCEKGESEKRFSDLMHDLDNKLEGLVTGQKLILDALGEEQNRRAKTLQTLVESSKKYIASLKVIRRDGRAVEIASSED